MVNVQQIVEKELERNLYLFDMLQLGIANITAVAYHLHPLIEKELKKEIKISAISMAIRRAQGHLSKGSNLNWKFPKNLEISLKSELFEVAIKRNDRAQEIMDKINAVIDKDKGDTFTFVEGTYEYMILINQKYMDRVLNALKKEKITSRRVSVGYVTVNWENMTKDIPGIYYRITRALAFRNISIQSFHTIGAEMMIIFKSDVLSEAYQTIHNLLNNKIQ
jgi:aspartokinase